jgi:MFS transporter, UMF1 family
MDSPVDEPDRRGWLEVVGLHRPELRAWVLYDWAVSGWQTAVLTTLFPIYFYELAAAGRLQGAATARFAAATALSVGALAIFAPVLGAIADRHAIRKMMLGICVGLGVVATASMSLVPPGDVALAIFLFVAAYLGASGSLIFYDALLPHVARRNEVDRVSTMGQAVGYLGGGLLLALNIAWAARPWGPGFNAHGLGALARQVFLTTAAWWLAFSIPLFRHVTEPAAVAGPGARPDRGLLVDLMARVGSAFGMLLQFKQAALMLIAFLVYQAGVETIQKMAAIFGREVGLGAMALLVTLVTVQFIGIPCAVVFGWLAGRLGAKVSILLALAVYSVASALAYFLNTLPQFVVIAILVAMVRGGCQALSRSLYTRLVPTLQAATFFGLFALVEKLAGALGPGAFALVIATTGSSRQAVGALVLFFLAGGALLALVDVRQGKTKAQTQTSPDPHCIGPATGRVSG